VSSRAKVIRNGARVIRSGAKVIRNGARVIRNGATPARSGARVILSRAKVIRNGATAARKLRRIKNRGPAERRASVKACGQKHRSALIFCILFYQEKSMNKKH
jgi:hypothetical protein